ncbi:MAG: RNA polymerase sigma factor RpoD, partial [Rhodoferax sp.]|nr:RNA polymerase sigma factor RpoD [Rhodoferax sp.]
MPATKPKKVAASKTSASVRPKSASQPIEPKVKPVTKAKAPAEDKKKMTAAAPVAEKKKTPKAAKSADKPATGAKRGPKAKAGKKAEVDDLDMSDIEDDLVGEPVVVEVTAEKVKPLRMKISKAKERALMKEFGLDETVLSEEDLNKRRLSLKALIKLGKTRGYLTHGEISDHLPDKLVDAETMEVVVSMLNDMGVAVYEHTPDAETLLLNQNGPTAATEEEAEEEAEAALSTVDSEFGRTTDPVRMYMREMGTVELLTREGEIEIAKRIEGGLMAMMEAISASPATIAEVLQLGEDIRSDKVVITTIVDGFTNPNEADDYV